MQQEKPEILEPQVTELIQRAELDSQIDQAKRYPRDLKKVKSNLLIYASVDQETAQKCFYAKPVDNEGTIAEGPSIRLAEIIKNVYQNMWTGVRVVEIGQKFVKVQGAARDLENNIYHSVEITKSIWSDRMRKRYSQNMIETTIRAAEALALRDAIFKCVPLGLFAAEMSEIKKIAIGTKSEVPLVDRVDQLVKFLEKEGISKKRILARLEVKKIEDITEDMVAIIMGLGNAVADGETSYEEAFPFTQDAEDIAQEITTNLTDVINEKLKENETSKTKPGNTHQKRQTKSPGKGMASRGGGKSND